MLGTTTGIRTSPAKIFRPSAVRKTEQQAVESNLGHGFSEREFKWLDVPRSENRTAILFSTPELLQKCGFLSLALRSIPNFSLDLAPRVVEVFSVQLF